MEKIDWESWQYWPYRSSPYWWDWKKQNVAPQPPVDPETFFVAFKNVRANVDVPEGLSPEEVERLVRSGDGPE